MRLTPRRRPWQPDHRLVRLLLLILLSKISEEPANCLEVDTDGDNDDSVIGNFSDSGVHGSSSAEDESTEPPPPYRLQSNVDDCVPCVCKWSGGKQVAECGGAQLVEVPRGLRTETQVREQD